MKVFALILYLSLAGCAAAIPLAIQYGPVVLSAAAKIACDAQSQANQVNESELSKAVGVFCTW